MPRHTLALIATIGAILITPSVNATCSDVQQHSTPNLDEIGLISKWDICYKNTLYRFVGAGQPRFELRLVSPNSLTVDPPNWKPGIEFTYVFTNAPHGVEVSRTYDFVSRFSFVHTVTLRNPGPIPLDNLQIELEIGKDLERDWTQDGSLAEYVYGFHRSAVTRNGHWLLASAGDHSKRYALVARHKALVIESSEEFVLQIANSQESETLQKNHSPQLKVVVQTGNLHPGESKTITHVVSALPTSMDTLDKAGYPSLMYLGQWTPVRIFYGWVENVLAKLSSVTSNVGVAIILFAALVRLITLPVNLWSARAQSKFVDVQTRIKPAIARVHERFKGAEQSERILAIYKEHGVSPFSGLKGSVGLFVQIPFLLAVFNLTTESSLLSGESFLWVHDLASPDAATAFWSAIPLVGSSLNILPILLGAVNLLSTIVSHQAAASAKSSILGFAITLLIIVFFYSFAAGLVLYWLTINSVQVMERYIFRSIGKR